MLSNSSVGASGLGTGAGSSVMEGEDKDKAMFASRYFQYALDMRLLLYKVIHDNKTDATGFYMVNCQVTILGYEFRGERITMGDTTRHPLDSQNIKAGHALRNSFHQITLHRDEGYEA